MSYQELKKLFAFRDSDLIAVNENKEEDYDARILNEWSDLRVKFIGDRYNGTNPNVLVTAVYYSLLKFDKDDPIRKTYPYPSIMVEEDMHQHGPPEKKMRYDRGGIWSVLQSNGWRLLMDQDGRQCKVISPEITYAELQSSIHFLDTDVARNMDVPEGKSALKLTLDPNKLHYETPEILDAGGKPHAYIKTKWYTCNIYYMGKIYSVTDKSVKLRAVIIDNEEQAKSDKAKKAREKGAWGQIRDLISK